MKQLLIILALFTTVSIFTDEKELKELVKEIEEDMADLEEKVSDTIQKTLANPLAGMK